MFSDPKSILISKPVLVQSCTDFNVISLVYSIATLDNQLIMFCTLLYFTVFLVQLVLVCDLFSK